MVLAGNRKKYGLHKQHASCSSDENQTLQPTTCYVLGCLLIGNYTKTLGFKEILGRILHIQKGWLHILADAYALLCGWRCKSNHHNEGGLWVLHLQVNMRV